MLSDFVAADVRKCGSYILNDTSLTYSLYVYTSPMLSVPHV